MSIQKDLDELTALNTEIRRLQESIRTYRKQKKTIEDRIIAFLKEQETHGVRYNDQAVLLENKMFRGKKKKAEKVDDVQNVLRRYGVRTNDALIHDLLDAQRGREAPGNVLKVVRQRGPT